MQFFEDSVDWSIILHQKSSSTRKISKNLKCMFPKHFKTDLKWFTEVAEDFHLRLWKQILSVSPASTTNHATTDRKSDEWPCCLLLPTSPIQFQSFARKLANNRAFNSSATPVVMFFFLRKLVGCAFGCIWSAHLSSLVTAGADSRGPLFVTYVHWGLKLVFTELWDFLRPRR